MKPIEINKDPLWMTGKEGYVAGRASYAAQVREMSMELRTVKDINTGDTSIFDDENHDKALHALQNLKP